MAVNTEKIKKVSLTLGSLAYLNTKKPKIKTKIKLMSGKNADKVIYN
jgi:hypothetical protein